MDFNVKKILQNTSFAALEKLLRIGSNVYIFSSCSKVYGIESIGRLGYILSIVAILSVISRLGTDQFLSKDISRYTSGKINTVLASGFFIRLVGTLISFLIYFTLVGINPYLAKDNFYILLITAGSIFESLLVIELLYQNKLQSQVILIVSGASNAISSLIKLGIVYNGLSFELFIVSYALEPIFLGTFYFISYKYTNKNSKSKINLTYCKYILTKSFPLLLSNLAIILYMKSSQLMLGNIVDAHELGTYIAATRITEYWLIVPSTLATAFFPILVNAKSNYDSKFTFVRYYVYVVGLTYLFILATNLYIKEITMILYGKSYEELINSIRIISVSTIFTSLALINVKWMIINNKQSRILQNVIIGLVLNVALNYFLIPEYGSIGAAAATCITSIIVNYLIFGLRTDTRENFFLSTHALLLNAHLIIARRK
jgi:O-antigen/teichoic acid export membrane protein